MGQFRLHQHSRFIRRDKGRLRRAMAVKPQAVDAVCLVFQQDAPPGVCIHGAIACFREYGAVRLAAQENAAVIQRQMPFLRPEVADAEAYGAPFQSRSRYFQIVKVSFSDIPPPYSGFQFQVKAVLLPSGRCADRLVRFFLQGPGRKMQSTLPGACGVDFHFNPQMIALRIHASVRYEHLPFGTDPDRPQQPVPVCLGFIRRGGGVNDSLPGPAGITVVGKKAEIILSAHQPGDFKGVRRGQIPRAVRHRFP